MIVDRVELTMSHLGLGNLNEYALMVLFGNAHSHHLTEGVDTYPDEIKDAQGAILYPAYFMTHLRVPAHALLPSFKPWRTYDIGVDVRRFGETLLDSTYLFCPADQIAETYEKWDLENFPSMQGNNLIVVDVTEGGGSGNRRVSVPKPDNFAVLPKIKRVPPAVIQAKKIRTNGFTDENFKTKIETETPISYEVAPGRDAAPGHAMIFAKFVEVMDYAEHQLLTHLIRPGFSSDILSHLAILEREIYYYGNCFADETLDIYVKADIEDVPMDYHGDSLHVLSTALFKFQIEVYQRKNNLLLAMSNVKKLLAIPTYAQDLIPDIKRILSRYI